MTCDHRCTFATDIELVCSAVRVDGLQRSPAVNPVGKVSADQVRTAAATYLSVIMICPQHPVPDMTSCGWLFEGKLLLLEGKHVCLSPLHVMPQMGRLFHWHWCGGRVTCSDEGQRAHCQQVRSTHPEHTAQSEIAGRLFVHSAGRQTEHQLAEWHADAIDCHICQCSTCRQVHQIKQEHHDQHQLKFELCGVYGLTAGTCPSVKLRSW